MTSYINLFTTVSKENQSLTKTINYMKDTTSTDNQRIIYGNDQILWYQSLNNILFMIYSLLFLILIILLFFRKYLPYIKFFLFVFFLLLPFIITPIEIIIYNIYVYIYTLFMIKMYPGNAFSK